jgi:Zn finger protein HypA/HybF involved in hydrogenase expression
MNVSRQTFGNIIDSAHKKIADALLNGKALKIEGGTYAMAQMRKFECSDCDHVWQIPHGTGRPQECPQCKNTNIHRAEDDGVYARKGAPGFGRGRCRRFQS